MQQVRSSLLETLSSKGNRRQFCAVLCLLALTSSIAHADEVLVSAAASLTESMKEVGAAFTKANPNTTVRFNFGASGALLQQIQQGAPVDVFASAGIKEMDVLEKAGKLVAPTRRDFASNQLVLIAPKSGTLRSWADLGSPKVKRVAISNPDSVPSGRYAKEALIKRKLWPAVESKAVFGENVRQTLTYVANGDADAGFVFATDARMEASRVKVVDVAKPGVDHELIRYPAAVIKDAPNPVAASRFTKFLAEPVAQGIFAKYGFTILTKKNPPPKPRKSP